MAGHSLSAAPIAVSMPQSAGRRISARTAPPARTAGTRSNRKYAVGPTSGTNHNQNVTASLRRRPLVRQRSQLNAPSAASIESANKTVNATGFAKPRRNCGSMTPKTGSGYS